MNASERGRLGHVVSMVYDRPWFVRPEEFLVMDQIVRMHMAGARLSNDEMRERLDAAAARSGPRSGQQSLGNIAVIPIYGMIFPRATMMTEMSGGSTVQGIRAMFQSALADTSVGSILFDVDSPGGYTDGIEELATEIRGARGQKPIVALADYTMASAAYYLGSQADEIVASPSSMVGWIGTVLVHTEFSKQDEQEGVTNTVLRNPPGKFAANQFEVLSDTGRAELQQQVDDHANQFFNAVSKGRGVSVGTVKADFGSGGGMSAARAKTAGLVDGVGTFDDTIRRMAAGKIGSKGRVGALTEAYQIAAANDWLPIEEIEKLPADERDAAYQKGLMSGRFTINAVRAAELARVPDPQPVPDPTPPDRSREAAAALALARARTGR